MPWLFSFTKNCWKVANTDTLAASVMDQFPNSMPAYEGILSDGQIDCIYKYLESLSVSDY